MSNMIGVTGRPKATHVNGNPLEAVLFAFVSPKSEAATRAAAMAP